MILKDNTGCITTAKDPALHARTKHTLLKFKYVREAIKQGHISISFLDTNNIPDNSLTKPLIRPKYKAFLRLLSLDIIN